LLSARAATFYLDATQEDRGQSALLASQAGVRGTYIHDGPVRGAFFNGDESHLISWSEDGTVRLWDVGGGRLLRTFPHDGPVFAASLNEDESRLLSWSRDATARLWDVIQNLTKHRNVGLNSYVYAPPIT
jgi:WD40 repeat protein